MRTLIIIAALALGIPAAKAGATCNTVCHHIGGGYQSCTTTCS